MNTNKKVKVRAISKAELLRRLNDPYITEDNVGKELDGQLHGYMVVIGECGPLSGIFELRHEEGKFTVNVVCCR